MNVLQIANGYLDKNLYRHLFSHMNRLGITNQVFVPVQNGNNYNAQDSNVTVCPCFSSMDRYLYFPKQRKTICALKKYYRFDNIDIIHAHTLFSTGYAAYKISKQINVPFVVAVRNTDVNLFFEKMPFLKSVGINIMKSASSIVFLSPEYRELVLKKYVGKSDRDILRKKSVVIPNGIDDYYFENRVSTPKNIENPIRIIHVGDINKNKNLEATIAALGILQKEKNIDVQYIVVGDIRDSTIGDIIKTNNNITYFTKCPKEEVIKHLRSSDILVVPSHRETFGLVYAEAMSQGLPVIYTKGQGFDGQFEDGVVGYAVDDKNPYHIADCIQKIISNYTEISMNCISLVEKFDWNKIASRYWELYSDVTTQKR